MKRNDKQLRPIPNFPDYYVDEELGNIWSFKKTPGILKPQPSGRSTTGKPVSVMVTLYLNGKGYKRKIGRLVMNITNPNVTVDHKDRDIWNNKKRNLRIATQQQQLYNKNAKSGFKGVRPHGRGYDARVQKNYKSTYLGTFDTAIQAAQAYNEAAKEHFGDFAVLNDVSI